MIKQGLSGDEASANFWVLDQEGLITASRQGIKEHVRVFARVQDDEKPHDGDDLLAVVKRVKPTGTRAGLVHAGRQFMLPVVASRLDILMHLSQASGGLRVFSLMLRLRACRCTDVGVTCACAMCHLPSPV